jgi:hypothetical protein
MNQACRTNPKKIESDAANEPGGSDNVRILFPGNMGWRTMRTFTQRY